MTAREEVRFRRARLFGTAFSFLLVSAFVLAVVLYGWLGVAYVTAVSAVLYMGAGLFVDYVVVERGRRRLAAYVALFAVWTGVVVWALLQYDLLFLVVAVMPGMLVAGYVLPKRLAKANDAHDALAPATLADRRRGHAG